MLQSQKAGSALIDLPENKFIYTLLKLYGHIDQNTAKCTFDQNCLGVQLDFCHK